MIVDAVFLWVDGDDPLQRDNINKYKKNPEKGLVKGALSETRFSNKNEIFYSVNLLRKNAPWINNIYIVTDSQVPKWLNKEVAKKLRVEIIDHRVIFEGYENFLPTFNSRSIEAMIWKIPNLADNFIYLNDDFFVIDKVSIEDYFSNNQPLFRGCWIPKNINLARLQRLKYFLCGNSDKLYGLVGLRPDANLLQGLKYFSMAHAPYPIVKSEYSRIFENEDFLIENIKYKFRNSKQIWPIGCYANKVLKKNKNLVVKKDWSYLEPSRNFNSREVMKELISDSRHLCIQSLDKFSLFAQKEIEIMLNEYLY